jgi:hypothetical protein
MKTALGKAMIVWGFFAVAANAWAKSPPGIADIRIGRKQVINAALMFSGGESATCQMGNIADAFVVTVSVSGNPNLSRYISGGGLGGCVVLPIALRAGAQIDVTGVLQDTGAIPNNAAASISSISEGCFNVEGFSVGLAANSGSEFDPLDPDNIINRQGYGFLWYDSDSDLKPGPYSYTVVGCSGENCSTATNYYNTDSSPGAGACTVLLPFP